MLETITYEFNPADDITLQELAQILKHYQLQISGLLLSELTEEQQRHFIKVDRTMMPRATRP